MVAALEPFALPWRTSPEALLAALDPGRAARAAFVAALVNALLAEPLRLALVGERRRCAALAGALGLGPAGWRPTMA